MLWVVAIITLGFSFPDRIKQGRESSTFFSIPQSAPATCVQIRTASNNGVRLDQGILLGEAKGRIILWSIKDKTVIRMADSGLTLVHRPGQCLVKSRVVVKTGVATNSVPGGATTTPALPTTTSTP